MEYVEGTDLAELVERQRAAAGRRGVRLRPPGGAGLQHAHEQGMVHRDIKPQNLMRDAARGQVKILDFGLARFASEVAPGTARG